MIGCPARVVTLLAMLALAGCGSSAATSSRSSSTTARRSTTATKTLAPRRRRSRPASTTASSTSSAPATTSSSTGTLQDRPSPTPAGTPAAPAGLTATTGYGTYELCAGTCSGSVPGSLRRPLHLPSGSAGSCPASATSGPVRASPSSPLAVSSFIGSPWLGGRVLWTASGSYRGPLLIRGRQLGDSGAVGFGEGRVPYDELQLLSSGQGAPPVSGGGRAWMSYTRVKASGCYAYQVDGTTFSQVIVFKATG